MKKKIKKTTKKPVIDMPKSFDLEKYTGMTKFHLEQVKQTTGEILPEDVVYCMSLTERIRKFESHAKKTTV